MTESHFLLISNLEGWGFMQLLPKLTCIDGGSSNDVSFTDIRQIRSLIRFISVENQFHINSFFVRIAFEFVTEIMVLQVLRLTIKFQQTKQQKYCNNMTKSSQLWHFKTWQRFFPSFSECSSLQLCQWISN